MLSQQTVARMCALCPTTQEVSADTSWSSLKVRNPSRIVAMDKRYFESSLKYNGVQITRMSKN